MSSAQSTVLRMPWQMRRNGSSLRTLLLMLALIAVPVVLTAMHKGIALTQWLGALGWVWLSALWWVQVDGLLRQNRPDLALLLPGQQRALRRSLVTQALLFGAAMVACIGLALGLREEWLWLTAVLLPVLAWLQREPLLWLPLSLLSIAPLRLRGGLDALMTLPLAGKGLALLVLMLLLVAVIGSGGAWHRWLFARQQRWQQALQAQTEGRAGSAQQGVAGRAMAAIFGLPALLYRRALLKHANRANTPARLEIGLDGGLLPLVFCVLALALCAALLAIAVIAHYVPEANWVQIVDNGRFGLCIGLFSILCSGPLSRHTTLWGRRREQALLVLLPGLPQGAAQAEVLETRWRRQYLALWLFGSFVVLSVGSLGSPSTLDFVAAHAAGCLPMAWLAQAQLRRLLQRTQRPSFAWWSAWPALMAVPAYIAQQAGMPSWLSLFLGVLCYAACAVRAGAPTQAMLPAGRG